MDDIRIAGDEGVDPQWNLEQEPPPGAHLTTTRRGYFHHGTCVGKGRVVHYAGLSGGFWQCGPVVEVSLSRFAVGRRVRVVDHPKSPYSPEEIVRRARSRLGENDYRVLTTNCEHFCSWCLSGVSYSAQVQQRLQLPFRVLNALFHRIRRSGFCNTQTIHCADLVRNIDSARPTRSFN